MCRNVCRVSNSCLPPTAVTIPLRFGEVAHAPPDLAKIPKPKGFTDQGEAKPWARRAGKAVGEGAIDIGSGGSGKKGHHKSRKAIGDDGGEGGRREGQEADAKKAQKRQMEEMRQRVQDAYSGLKMKRRAGQTQFVARDL